MKQIQFNPCHRVAFFYNSQNEKRCLLVGFKIMYIPEK